MTTKVLCIKHKIELDNRGVCPKCGGPWVRVVKKNLPDSYEGKNIRWGNDGNGMRMKDKFNSETKTLGWKPSCECGENPVPCVIFDPFLGSGTIGVVAQKYNRRWVGCELKWDYCKMSKKRTLNTDIAMI